MLSLALDSSTERSVVALLKDENALFSHTLPFGYQNSKYLVQTIQESLNAFSYAPKDLKLITVGVGPGSYTGIRVGMMIAKTLAFACKIPIVGISSLKVFTHQKPFIVLIDAKISGFYLYKNTFDQPMICSLEELGKYLLGTEIVLTPNATRIKSIVEQRYPEYTLEWIEQAPDPILLGKLGLQRFLNNDIIYPEPLYLR